MGYEVGADVPRPPGGYREAIPASIAGSSEGASANVVAGCEGAERLVFVDRARSALGKGLADWAMRAVACKLRVRPLPSSLTELIDSSIMREPFYDFGSEGPRCFLRGADPPVHAPGDVPIEFFLRSAARDHFMSVWRSVSDADTEEALVLFSRNADKGYDVLHEVPLVSALPHACIDSREREPPEGTVGVWANPVWCSAGIDEVLHRRNVLGWRKTILAVTERFLGHVPISWFKSIVPRTRTTRGRMGRVILASDGRAFLNIFRHVHTCPDIVRQGHPLSDIVRHIQTFSDIFRQQFQT